MFGNELTHNSDAVAPELLKGNKTEIKKPICPYCKSEMEAFEYNGYYESHFGWSCNCDKLPNAVEWRGAYT